VFNQPAYEVVSVDRYNYMYDRQHPDTHDLKVVSGPLPQIAASDMANAGNSLSRQRNDTRLYLYRLRADAIKPEKEKASK